MVDLVIDAKRAAVVKIGQALQPIADRNMGEQQPVNMQGTWSVGATMFGSSVRISTPDEVETRILARASGMIWASCYLPLITLLPTRLVRVEAGLDADGVVPRRTESPFPAPPQLLVCPRSPRRSWTLAGTRRRAWHTLRYFRPPPDPG